MKLNVEMTLSSEGMHKKFLIGTHVLNYVIFTHEQYFLILHVVFLAQPQYSYGDTLFQHQIFLQYSYILIRKYLKQINYL